MKGEIKAMKQNGMTCKNCNTENAKYYPLKRGYCKRCYPIILRIEKTRNWEYGQLSTLKNFPLELEQISESMFFTAKTGVIKQLQERLNHFRYREEKLNKNIRGIELEFAFNKIARLCGIKKRYLFHGTATFFDHNFDENQKKLIFTLFDKIEENIRWEGINWGKIIADNNSKV